MPKYTTGQILKQQRLAKALSQRELSRLTSLSQSMISRFERDLRLPAAAEWQKLAAHLELGSAPPTPLDFPGPSAFWRTPRPALSCTVSVPFRARQARGLKSFGALWSTLVALLTRRSDAADVLRYLNSAGLDSADETMFSMQVMAGGGKPIWNAPLRAGFRKFPVLERSERRRCVGDIRHQCLEVVREDYAILFFPQIPLGTRRGIYVLDMLVCVRRRGRRVWFNVELDGGGHRSEFDDEREMALGLPTLRLSPTDLAKVAMLEELERRLLDRFDQGRRDREEPKSA